MEGLEDLEEMLDGLKASAVEVENPLQDLTDLLGDLGSRAMQAATGFDASANRFRNSSGQFQSASSTMSGVFQGSMTKIAGAAKDVTPALAGLGGSIKNLATGEVPSAQQAMTMLGATMGGAVKDATRELGQALGALGPEGQAAGAAIEAIGAAVGATIGSLTTLMGLVISVTEKATMMKDRFAALAGTAAGGAAVQAMLSHLNLPFATSEVNGWAQSLLAAGVKGKQLEADVKAIAAATALMGENGGAAAETLFKRLGEGGPAADKLLKTFQTGGPKADKLLKGMGLSLKDLGGKAAVAKMTAEQLHEALAKAMQKKGAGPLADMGGTMSVILMKAQEGFRSLFSKLGPAVKPFMQAVQKLFAEFNKGGSVIKLLQPIVTSVMTTLFSWGTSAVKVVKQIMDWFLASGKAGGMFSGVVKAMKVGWSALVSIFGVVKAALAPILAQLKQLFSNATVLKGIKTIFTIIAGAIMVVVVVIGALVAAAAMMVGGIAAAFAAVVGIIAGAVGGITEALSAFDFSAFVAKMSGMAAAGLAAFKGVFGINSPSTVLLEHGEEDMAGAAATGVEQGAPKLKGSMAKMADDAKPKKGKSGAVAKGEGAESGGPTFIYHDCDFGGVDQSAIDRMMLIAFAKAAANAGAKPQGAS